LISRTALVRDPYAWWCGGGHWWPFLSRWAFVFESNATDIMPDNFVYGIVSKQVIINTTISLTMPYVIVFG